MNDLCEYCGKPLGEEWRTDVAHINKHPQRFCSASCARRFSVSKEDFTGTKKAICAKCGKEITVNKRTSAKKSFCEECKKKKKEKPSKIVPIYTCAVCGEVFQAKRSRKTCSDSCRGYLLSINRQQVIKDQGIWSTPREHFQYGCFSGYVDSNLEKAFIQIAVDSYKVKSITNYENILNYWEGDAHRTYNPDFFLVLEDGTKAVAEVKMKWYKASQHVYYRNIPLKKKALQEYCNRKGFKMLWIDYDTEPLLRNEYKKVLKHKNGE